MNQDLNNKILEIIKEHYSDNKKAISELMNILNLSRESVYRRVRNEIPFNLNEVVILSNQIGFSIDTLTKQGNNNRSFFNFFMSKKDEPDDSFVEIMTFYAHFLKKITHTDDSKITMVANQLSFVFLAQFNILSKFVYFKWIHQTQNIPLFYKFSDFRMSEKVKLILKEYLSIAYNLKNIVYIFDRNVILSLINDIKYYYKRDLINDKEVSEFKEEMLAIIKRLEIISHNGYNEYGTKIKIYISEIFIDTNYIYNEYGGKKSIGLYNDTILPLTIYDEEICKSQERKIYSLLKYSTLISESNELLRADFFNLQRKYIENW